MVGYAREAGLRPLEISKQRAHRALSAAAALKGVAKSSDYPIPIIKAVVDSIL